MSDAEWMLAVLVVLYLSDCLIWFPRNALLLVSHSGRRWRVLKAVDLPGNDRGGFLLANPLPPLGYVHAVTPWTLCFGLDRVVFTPCQGIAGSAPPVPEPGLPYEEAAAVAAVGNEVRLNGEAVTVCGSAAGAVRLADMLRLLAAAGRSAREEMIRREMGARLDADSARARIAEARDRTAGLRAACVLLWAYLFLVGPLTVARLGQEYLLHVIAGVPLCLVPVLLLFVRSHRRLRPGERGERWTEFTKMALCPPMAVRAVDVAARHVAGGLDPLAVALVVLDRAEYRAFARAAILDLDFPVRGEGDELDDTVAWFRTCLRDVCGAFVEVNGEELTELLAPPPADGGSVAYCPRCHCTYARSTGVCSDCAGVSLEPFPLIRSGGPSWIRTDPSC